MINIFSNGYTVAADSVLVVLLLTCSVFDIKYKIIPNKLVLVILVLGLALNLLTQEGVGPRNAMIGLLGGFSIMLLFYIFSGVGAGDVKLIAAIGSVVGIDKVLEIIIDSALVMGFISLMFLVVKGDLFKLLLRFKRFGVGLLSGVFSYERAATTEAAAQRLPMAPAVTVATVYVILSACRCLGLVFDFIK